MSADMDSDKVGEAVRIAMSHYGAQLEPSEITDATSMSLDARIDGIDVYDFAQELEATFGAVVWTVPWGRFSDQRASFYGCGTLMVPFWLLWRLFRWPFDGHWIPPTNGGDERLTVGHLTNVLFSGEWFEPESLAK